MSVQIVDHLLRILHRRRLTAAGIYSRLLGRRRGAATPGLFARVQACEAQMHRMAGLNKTLAANYNAERVHNECMTSVREAVASE